MKKLLFVFACLVFASSSYAGILDQLQEVAEGNIPQHGPAGCGLGTMFFTGKNGKTSNALAASTNGISFNNAFGVSSGTSGCGEVGAQTAVNPLLKSSLQQKLFIAANITKLIEQMSLGEGEFLAAYGEVLGCSSASLANFAKASQSNFDNIFSEGNNEDAVLKNTKVMIQADETLAASCTQI